MIKLRDKAHSRYRVTKLDKHKQYYKSLKALVKSSIYREKCAYFNQCINSKVHDSKSLWKGLKKNILFDVSSHDIQEHFDNLNDINDHFLNIPSKGTVQSDTVRFYEQNKYHGLQLSLNPVHITVQTMIAMAYNAHTGRFDEVTETDSDNLQMHEMYPRYPNPTRE
ncbi:hypothetical protein ACJJTC_011813 [Scirpophaga incertulas]